MRRASFKPYEGSDPFIFISYAHRNSKEIIPILEALDRAGYRVWYDDGIAPGSEWPEYIAEHLNASSVVLAFVSQASIDSPNCRREVTYALAKQKPFLGVVLEQARMSPGMELQLAAQQCILRYNYLTEEEFLTKLLGSEVLAPCRKPAVIQEAETATKAEEPVRPLPAAPEKTGSTSGGAPAAPKKKLPVWLIAAAACLVIAGILAVSGVFRKENEPDASDAPGKTSAPQTQEIVSNSTAQEASTTAEASEPAQTDTPAQTDVPPEGSTEVPEEVPFKGELELLMSVTEDASRQYTVYQAGVVCIDQNDQTLGLVSYDGKSVTEPTYPIGSPFGDYENYEGLYLIVSTNGSAWEKTPESLNRLGLIDAHGNEVIPEGYAEIDDVNRYYALCIRVTEETADPEEAVISIPATVFSADASKDEKVLFKGEWELVSLKTGRPVPGISGTKASEYNDRWKYSSYYYGELIELAYNQYMRADGSMLDAGATVFSNGSYSVATPSKGTVYNSDGTERFSFDPNQYQIRYEKGAFFGYRKLSDGSHGYTLLDEDGQPVSVEFSVKGYNDPISCGPFILMQPDEDSGWHIYDRQGGIVSDRNINQYYAEYDELHHVLKAETKEENETYLFFSDDGELLLEVSGNDVRVTDFLIRKDDLYYNFATKAFDIKGDRIYHSWWVAVRNDGGKYELVDTFTGQALLRGYDSYRYVESPEYGTVIGGKYNQTTDVFILR